MRAIATDPHICDLIQQNAPVAIGVSGGKDSQAAAIATLDYLVEVGHSGPVVLIHSDLGVVEWKQSLTVCERLADRLGLELIVVRRKSGDLMDRWEARWQSSKTRYENLETVTLVPCWSTPAMRFCTSELKTHIISAELKRRFKGPIINVTGVRREESAARAKGTIAGSDAEGRIWSWRPLSDWTVDDVFAAIAEARMEPHQAYTEFGMSRVSCMFCIMSNGADLAAAAEQAEAEGLYLRMVALESASTFAFQGSRWLGDVKPSILPEAALTAFQRAKQNAARRVQIEAKITKGMRYVAGWPTRMLTNDEALILADVRNELSDMLQFNSRYLTVDEIHSRYDELMRANDARRAA